MSLILSYVLNSPYLLPIAAVLISVGTVYLKGYNTGSAAVKADDAEAIQKINDGIHKAEAQNQKIDQQREQNLEKINAADDVKQLIKLWDEFGPKAPGSDAKKDS